MNMKSRLSLHLGMFGLFLLMSFGLWAVKQKRDVSTRYLLSKYPKTPLLNYIVNEHEYHIRSVGDVCGIFSTWFVKGKKDVVQRCEVDGVSVGNQVNISKIQYRNFNPCSTVGCHETTLFYLTKSLTDAQRQSVKLLLRQLPQNQDPVNAQNILILTFCANDSYDTRTATWDTRLYDRSKLPPVIKQIYRIIGAPLEEVKP